MDTDSEDVNTRFKDTDVFLVGAMCNDSAPDQSMQQSAWFTTETWRDALTGIPTARTTTRRPRILIRFWSVSYAELGFQIKVPNKVLEFSAEIWSDALAGILTARTETQGWRRRRSCSRMGGHQGRHGQRPLSIRTRLSTVQITHSSCARSTDLRKASSFSTGNKAPPWTNNRCKLPPSTVPF